MRMTQAIRHWTFILLNAASVMLWCHEVHSQSISYWNKIVTFPEAAPTDVYFIDSLHGMVALAVGGGIVGTTDSAKIFYTADQVTWRQSITPPIGVVNAIRSINGKLYAAVMAPDLLVSTDSGASWNFSGLGFDSSWDVYSDASGNIRVLNGSNFIRATFARVDKFHCLASGYAGSFLSVDGGVSWFSVSIGFNFPGFSNYGDTCAHIFVYHNVGGNVYTSSDRGSTWQPAGPSFEPQTDIGLGQNVMEGTSGVVYEGTIRGMYRTTDLGITWTSAASPSFNATGYTHFSVNGPTGGGVIGGATEISSSGTYQGEVWVTTTGGDGTLGDPVLSPDSLPGVTSSNDTTQMVSACGGVRVPIPMLAQAADGISLQVSIASDSLHEFSILDSSSIILRSGVRDTLWVQYVPRAQPATSMVRLTFNNTWHCSNWSETRTIIVTTPPTAFAIAPHSLSGSCQLLADSGFVQIDTCQSLVVTSVTVSEPLSNRLLFQSPLPDTIGNARHTALPFQFDPRDTNMNGDASVELHGFYLGTSVPFDTMLTVHLSAIPGQPNLVVPTASLNFGTLALCSGFAPRDTTLTFTNAGCAPDTITSVGLTGAGFTWMIGHAGNDSLPIVVLPGDSVTFSYRFVPPDSGTFTGQVTLNVVSMGLTETPVISLSGSGVQGLGVLDVPRTFLQTGSFSFCSGDTTVSDTISNTGCDTLVISNLVFAGDTTFSLVPNANDSLLLPGASRVFQFHFAPRVKGAQSASLRFHSRNIQNDPGRDTMISLAGTGLGGTKTLSADTALRDFGALYACQSRDTTLVLSNTGCDTLTIDSGGVSNGTYAVNATYPIILPPDSSATVTIHLTADSAGMNGILTFFADSGVRGMPLRIPLTASIIPPARLVLDLSPSDTATDGDTVICYVLLMGTVPTGAVSSLQFDITHNNDLLTYEQSNGVTMTGSAGTAQRQSLHFSAGSQAGSMSHVDTLGTITFRVYLSDSGFTPLTLSNVGFTNTLSLADDCIASIVDSGASFTYVYTCGEPLMQDVMRGIPFSIDGIVPNPAGDVVEIRVAGGNSAAALHCELFDALGREADVHSTSLQGGVSLDVSGVPSGIYFVRVSAGGYVQSRSVVVEH